MEMSFPWPLDAIKSTIVIQTIFLIGMRREGFKRWGRRRVDKLNFPPVTAWRVTAALRQRHRAGSARAGSASIESVLPTKSRRSPTKM